MGMVTFSLLGMMTLILGAGALLAVTFAIGTLSIAAADRGTVPIEWIAVAAIINDQGFIAPIVIVLIGIPLVFPDGRLLSRRWRGSSWSPPRPCSPRRSR